MKIKYFIALVVITIFLFTGCTDSVFIHSQESAEVIDKIPIFGSLGNSVSRAAFTSEMDDGDAAFAMFAPPISRFEDATETYIVGDSIKINYLSNEINFDTSFTEEGYIKLAGTIVEKNHEKQDIETGKIIIMYDKVNSKFSYYSEILLSDPEDILEGWDLETHMYIINEIPFTQINENNSFLGNFTSFAYLKNPSTYSWVILIDSGEIYSGPMETPGQWIVGFISPSMGIVIGDDLANAKIDANAYKSLINETGQIVSKDLFEARRAAIVGARDTLFEAGGIKEPPLVGFKIGDHNSYETTYCAGGTDYDETKKELYLSCNMDGGYLKDTNGDIIEFSGQKENPEKMAINKENMKKLLTALPNADWRSNSLLVGKVE